MKTLLAGYTRIMRGTFPVPGSAWPALTLLILALSACAPVGPEYTRPTMNIPDEYRAVSGAWKSARPGDTLPRGKWWEIYGDRELSALIERVEVGNQTLYQAQARYAQAQAALRQASAARYPFITGNASARRSRTHTDGSRAVSDFEIGADLSWELDLWGRIRQSIQASASQAQAAAADVESVRLSSIAALASNYFAIRAIDAQARILQETVAAFNRSLTLTTNRYKAGVVGKADVVQAEAQVRSTQAQLVDLGVQRAQFEHAIALLIGESPRAVTVSVAGFNAKLPAIPAGLPSELLQRRPDIAAAERRVAAANARIGIAQAALFPSVDLTAGAGITSATFPDLLRAPTLFWALGAAAVQVLFDAGERRSAVDQARAALDAEAAFYRQTVLTGFQEVEDNLAALRILEEEAKLQDAAVAAARESVKLTENRYRAGTASFLEVIVVQTIALNNERSAVSVHGRRLLASVQLIKALGGGWQASALDQARAGSMPDGGGHH